MWQDLIRSCPRCSPNFLFRGFSGCRYSVAVRQTAPGQLITSTGILTCEPFSYINIGPYTPRYIPAVLEYNGSPFLRR